MEIIDCYWEMRNLNSKVVEVEINQIDTFQEFDFSIINGYDYIVVKVPVNKPDFNFGLAQQGFTMIELQMDMSVRLKEFDFQNKLLKWILPYTTFEEVKTFNELDFVIGQMTPGMFSTDRISLDVLFGLDKGCKRYQNWIFDEYSNHRSKIIKIVFKEIDVGFMMYREDKNIRGLLGGIYNQYQDKGLGLLIPCTLPIYVNKTQLLVSKITANISSNNQPVWELYENFGYKATNPHYVFVKHL